MSVSLLWQVDRCCETWGGVLESVLGSIESVSLKLKVVTQ